MSEKIKIKLNIADRVYPLSISPNQESSLRASAIKIDSMTKQLENNYAVRDKQDVLACVPYNMQQNWKFSFKIK